ncbi:MAG TPA: ABC transporter ATP-binding protein, partial [Phycisphaerae bacterium]
MADAQVQLRGIAKKFGDFTAVQPLDLQIAKGEFLVLLGPSGCGKTTTLRMIAGLEMPSAGTVMIADRDVTALRPGERDIAFVFQMFSLYPHLSVRENIAFPLRAAGVARAQAMEHVDRVAQRLGITDILNRKPGKLAGGDQQRVSLARAMVRRPAAFLMDEPLGTLDAHQREGTRAELRAIHNELGATTIFVTHDQLEAMSLADRIAIMRDGRLLQCAPPREVYDFPADLFVANFIGSPGMNFLDARRTGETYQVQGTAMQLPAGSAQSSNLTLGIRPEYVRIDPAGVEAVAEQTQRLGAYNLLALRLGDKTIKARVPADLRVAANESVRIGFDP